MPNNTCSLLFIDVQRNTRWLILVIPFGYSIIPELSYYRDAFRFFLLATVLLNKQMFHFQ